MNVITRPEAEMSSTPLESPAKIDVRHLDFYYGATHALKDISATFPSNAITAIIGPSGCGKSTLLRTFNRIYEAYPRQRATGEVLLDGVNILDGRYNASRLRSEVGMVFQKPTPFYLSIFENIAFPLRHYEKLTGRQMADRVEEALRQAALWEEAKDVLSRSAFSLSGGQQQRLCIARTLAVRPDVILFDEPTSALDPISTAKIEELLSELKQTMTIAIVTHNMQQAARVADQVLFMYDGELVEAGSTERIFTSPREKRTSDYVTGRFG